MPVLTARCCFTNPGLLLLPGWCWVAQKKLRGKSFTKDSDTCWEDMHTEEGQLALRPGSPCSAWVPAGSRLGKLAHFSEPICLYLKKAIILLCSFILA